MANLSQLVQYQRRCYQADNRETGIFSVLHEKNRHVRVFDGEEIALSGTVGRVPLPNKFAEDARKDTFKYRRDKSLLYAAFPIVGHQPKLKHLGKRLCAPLVYFSAEFEESQGSLFLRPNLEDMRLNFPILMALGDLHDRDDEEVIDFCAQVPSAPWPREQTHSIAALFADFFERIDFTAISSFPELLTEKQLRALVETPSAELQCVNATSMALVPNSPDTRGVLFELEQIANSTSHSRALRAVLSGQQLAQSHARKRPCMAPSVLSDPQQRVIRSCRTHAATLVVGPPGTGKSHTIASLALDYLANNKTVLIASRMDQAVNVVAEKIEQLIGPTQAVVRAGRKQHLRSMKQSLDNLLQGITSSESLATPARQLFRRLKTLDKQLAREEDTFIRNQEREISWGELTTRAPESLVGSLTGGVLKRIRDWQLSGFDGWKCIEQYEGQLQRRCELSQQFLQATLAERTQKLLSSRREDLKKFSQAIRARSDGKQQQLFAEIDFSVLLHAFPIWLAKLSDLSNVLPLRDELFDLAILDEATQCDIASCLPLLQRAKRVAIVGDPKQLRHLSFLSESRQESIAEEFDLDSSQQEQFHFRRHSILDAAGESITSQEQVVFLNEHFRSLPQIIQFSNSEFYAGQLSVMRQRPYSKPPNAVQLRRVSGRRSKSGRNATEADALVEDLKQTVASSSQARSVVQSIGVLSPFREQVDYLSRAIDKELSFDEMQRHDLLVGTAHTFQGEERDVMYLSLAADDNSHFATFRFLENPNLLNVSVTRARHLQFVYTSFDPERLDRSSLLRKWLDSVQNPRHIPVSKLKAVDSFRNDVVVAVSKLGFRTWKDYPVAGLNVDLIVESGINSIAIDLVGYPGALAESYSLERYRMINRSGLRLLPMSYRAWQENQATCVDRIESALQS